MLLKAYLILLYYSEFTVIVDEFLINLVSSKNIKLIYIYYYNYLLLSFLSTFNISAYLLSFPSIKSESMSAPAIE